MCNAQLRTVGWRSCAKIPFQQRWRALEKMTERMGMIGLKNVAAALALSLAVVAAVSPASAAQKHKHVSHAGRAANAQAVEGDAGGANGGVVMDKAREDAIRECSGQSNRLVQKDWGVMQGEMFASCMTQHGQMQ
jgi:uncharacterized low-complexity protein